MTTTTPPKPQDGEMPDNIIAYESAGRWWVPANYAHMFPPSMQQERYTRTASIAEGLKEKMDRGQFTYLGGEYVFCMKPDDARDLKALADSMIKEAGRETV